LKYATLFPPFFSTRPSLISLAIVVGPEYAPPETLLLDPIAAACLPVARVLTTQKGQLSLIHSVVFAATHTLTRLQAHLPRARSPAYGVELGDVVEKKVVTCV
jgi:hypothetical protein